jgi:hypothetical protein
VPLWNPYISCGWPFFANSMGFFFPLNIVFYVLPLWYAFGAYAFIKLFLAGLFTYLYLRTVSVNFFGSVVGSVSFMFCGFIIGWLGGTQPNIALLLPLLLLLTEKIVTEGALKYASLLSLVVGVSFLAGHYETTFHVLAATGLYFLFRLFTLYRTERDVKICLRTIVFFSASCIVGVGIASVQIIPAWEYIGQSSILGVRGGGGFSLSSFSFEALVRFFISLKALVLYLIPDFYGNPVDRNEWGSAVGMGFYTEHSGYVGVMPFFLAVLASVLCFKNKFVKFFLDLGSLSLAVVHRLPLVIDIVHSLPVFSKLNNNRLIMVYCFAAAALAGYGLSFLTEETAVQKREKKKKKDKAKEKETKKVYLLLAVFLTFSVLLAGILWYIITFGDIGAVVAKYNVGRYISRSILLFLLWGFGGIFLTFLYASRYIDQRDFKVLITIFIAVDLLSFGMRFWPTIKPEQIYPSTPAIEFLKKDKGIFRVFGISNVLSMNTWTVYGLHDIRGYDGITLRDYEKFITGKTGYGRFYMFGNEIPQHIDLMNVKYILLPRGFKLERSRYSKVYSGEIEIYENLNHLPRAFVVHRSLVVNGEEETLARLNSPGFNPSTLVLIDSALSPAQKRLIEGVPVKDGSTAHITDYSHNRITIDVKMQNPGFLVLSDTYYPGWKAFIDGSESPIYRADYIFRAIFLDRGKHTVEFRYEPLSFRVGSIITLFSLFLAAGVFIYGLVLSRKDRKERT